MRRSTKEKLLVLAVCAGCAVLFSAPRLFTNWLWPNADFFIHYRRAAHFWQALREGTLYPRWDPAANFGLGEPVFLYYSPLYYYVVAAVHALGVSLWTAMKMVEVAAATITGVFVYRLCRNSGCSQTYSLIAAAVIEAAPFPALVLNYFNDLPSYAALAATSAVLYYSLQEPEGERLLNPKLSLWFAVLVATHILSAFVVGLSLLALLATNPEWVRGHKRVWQWRLGWLYSCALGLGLASAYFVPALASRGYLAFVRWTDYGTGWQDPAKDWHRNFVCPIVTRHFFGMRWPLFQFPAPVVVVLMLLVVTVYLHYRPTTVVRPVLIGLLASGWWGMFFASEFSYPLWAISKQLQLLQFPYRFLPLAGMAAVVANVICLSDAWGHASRRLRLTMVLPICLSVIVFIAVTIKFVARDGHQVSPGASARRTYPGEIEYVPITAGPNWKQYASDGGLQHECAVKQIRCISRQDLSEDKSWAISANDNRQVVLPILGFPAWSVTVNNVPQQLDIDPATGLVRVPLTPGLQTIEVKWRGLPQEKAGLIISVLSAALLLAAALSSRRPALQAPVNVRGRAAGLNAE